METNLEIPRSHSNVIWGSGIYQAECRSGFPESNGTQLDCLLRHLNFGFHCVMRSFFVQMDMDFFIPASTSRMNG